MISVTAPAPTVWPPSRIAKRKPFSRATGVISDTSQLTLSPGITISTPVGNFTSPVTAVAEMVMPGRQEEHRSELESRGNLACRLLLEKKKQFRSLILFVHF